MLHASPLLCLFLRWAREHGPNSEWTEHNFLFHWIQSNHALLSTVQSSSSASVGFQRRAGERHGSPAGAVQCQRGPKWSVFLSGLQQSHRHEQQHNHTHHDSKWVCLQSEVNLHISPSVPNFILTLVCLYRVVRDWTTGGQCVAPASAVNLWIPLLIAGQAVE